MKLKAVIFAGPVMAVIITFLMVPAIYGAKETQTGKYDSDSGTYEVGFGTMELFDHSRTMLEKYDYFGNIIDRETSRPIQICIWYPAMVSGDDLPMMISEYNFPYPEDRRFLVFLGEIQNREIAQFRRIAGQESVFDILNSETGAYRDASCADGEFPLIIYVPDAGHGISENFTLMERLAKNGYIAAAVHSVGTFHRDPSASSADFETITRDLEFAISSLGEHPHIDMNRIGVMGCGFGADAALLLKMRNYDIRAVVCLCNGGDDYDSAGLLKSNPYFDSKRVNVPSLWINRGLRPGKSPALLDSLIFSARYLINFLPDSGICLTNYDRYASAPLSDFNNESHHMLITYVSSFFDAFLCGEKHAESFWDSGFAYHNTKPDILGMRYIPAKKAPPTESQFMSIIETRGIETALGLYSKFKPDYPDHLFFREATFNIMGYRYLQSGRIPDALTVFEMNVDAYPYSANVYDSYGEACLAAGKYQRALENYKKALEILPNDTSTAEDLKTAIENGATQQIQRIEEILSQSESGENQ